MTFEKNSYVGAVHFIGLCQSVLPAAISYVSAIHTYASSAIRSHADTTLPNNFARQKETQQNFEKPRVGVF